MLLDTLLHHTLQEVRLVTGDQVIGQVEIGATGVQSVALRAQSVWRFMAVGLFPLRKDVFGHGFRQFVRQLDRLFEGASP